MLAQSPNSDAIRWSESVSQNYLVYPDQVYGFQSGVQLKLDVWQAQTDVPVPTVIYYHGGGWFFGDRTGAVPYFMPWIARGWNVINVEYRMSGTAPAPAAVQDARCALRVGSIEMRSSFIWILRGSSLPVILPVAISH